MGRAKVLDMNTLSTAALRKVMNNRTSGKALKCEVYDILLYRLRQAAKRTPGQRTPTAGGRGRTAAGGAS